MLLIFSVAILLLISGCSSIPVMDYTTGTKHLDLSNQINVKQWSAGSENCDTSTLPKIDVYNHSSGSYILRQSKCNSYEAPFIYVLIGSETVAVIDTGATENASEFPLSKTINQLMVKQLGSVEAAKRKILVLHTHSHSDHRAADQQFKRLANIEIIAPSADGLSQGLKFTNNLAQQVNIDLGERNLTIFQIPGHQDQSIAIYDSTTQWLLTGDTLYPGAIYVNNWPAFKLSIDRLAEFTDNYPVSAVLGAHIEMTASAGKLYTIGTTYQPNEAPLGLTVFHIKQLQSTLQNIDQAVEMNFDDFRVIPLSSIEKVISGVAKFVTGS